MDFEVIKEFTEEDEYKYFLQKIWDECRFFINLSYEAFLTIFFSDPMIRK